MTETGHSSTTGRHRMAFMVVLCLFGLGLLCAAAPKKKPRQKVDERVYLIHADELM